MIGSPMKNIFLAASALATVSCAGGPFNNEEHGMTVAERHPISVDSQVVTLTIDVDKSISDISDMDKARLRAFANAYMTDGHGPLTITAPSGTGDDFPGQEAAADIRKALNDVGVPWESISGATYRTAGAENGDQLIISYTHYVATASKCGLWNESKARGYRNLASPNFGCATQNNLAAMIADPRDLIEPTAVGLRDGAAATRAIELYRDGEITASQTGDIDARASN